MLQRELILSNLADARRQLAEIELSLQDPDYGEADFRTDMEHAYHHLNYAWNVRNVSDHALDEQSHEDFQRWSKFPVGEIEEYT